MITRLFWTEARELAWLAAALLILASPVLALLAFLVWAVTR